MLREEDVMEPMIRRMRLYDRTFFRMVIGYLVIVCVPIGTFCAIYTSMINNELRMSYSTQKQQWVNHSIVNLSTQLQEIENTYSALQTNSIFTEFLDYSGGDLQKVYQYIKYIRYCFSEAKIVNPHINEILLYTENASLLSLRAEFIPKPRLTGGENWDYRKGSWHYEPSGGSGASPGVYVYRHNVNNKNHSHQLGIMEIAVLENIINSCFFVNNNPDMRQSAFLVDANENPTGSLVFPYDNIPPGTLQNLAASLTKENKFLIDKDYTFYIGYIANLSLYYIEVEAYSGFFDQGPALMFRLLQLLIPLLIIFSLFYYMIVARFVSRIRRLSHHIHSRGGNLELIDSELIDSELRRDDINFLYQAYNRMMIHIRELISSLHMEENLRKEAAYVALQTKIQPHFLYGTLETIRMLAVKNHDRETAALTYSFSKLMRYSLGSASEVTLSQEIEYIKDYLAIQIKRFEPRLRVEFCIDVDADSVQCPFFILQPIVENAVMHGVSHCIGDSVILIRAEVSLNDYIEIHIWDNGVGIEPDMLEKIRVMLRESRPLGEQPQGNGVALYNVHERLRHYYGEGCGIEVESAPGTGTKVIVRIHRGRVEAFDLSLEY